MNGRFRCVHPSACTLCNWCGYRRVPNGLRALDLFCGAGGASNGLYRAGFEVVGVDIHPQPRYPFEFMRGDALDVELAGFDLIWASPPCQRYSLISRNMGRARLYPDFIDAARARLEASGAAWVIENVVGAPLRADAMLCGTMFGLNLLRHRIFETSFPITELLPSCTHRGCEVPVYGNGTSRWHLKRFGRGVSIAEKHDAMGIHWMTRGELAQAIPPVYAEFIAANVLRAFNCEDNGKAETQVENRPRAAVRPSAARRRSCVLGPPARPETVG